MFKRVLKHFFFFFFFPHFHIGLNTPTHASIERTERENSSGKAAKSLLHLFVCKVSLRKRSFDSWER